MKSLLLAIVFSILNYSQTEGRIKLSKEEDLELERQLGVLNKSPVKSFQNEDGSIIDCIDITKQPAFDHPLLKNHTIQMRPSSLPKGRLTRKSVSPRSTKRKWMGCPPRTVPIRRTTKEDLLRAKTLSGLYRTNANPSTSNRQGHYFATTKTTLNTSNQYYGAEAHIPLYNVKVSPNQFSEATLWVQNNMDGPLNSIQFGWAVNPGLYGDNRTRSVSYWTADGFQRTGCFNNLCPGFVQDPKSGNWWLVVDYEYGEGNVYVGYWPQSLFTSLAVCALELQFGGEVYSPPNEPPPPMGNGQWVPDEYVRTCFVSNIQFVDISNELYEPGDARMETFTDKPKCYQVDYWGFTGDKLRYAMLFGGPGGTACDE